MLSEDDEQEVCLSVSGLLLLWYSPECQNRLQEQSSEIEGKYLWMSIEASVHMHDPQLDTMTNRARHHSLAVSNCRLLAPLDEVTATVGYLPP